MTDSPDAASPRCWPTARHAELAARLLLDAEPAEVARAREWAAKALAECGRPEHAWLAQIVVSELVTNAIVHGAGPVSVGLSCGIGSVRVEVHDNHPGRPVRRRPAVDEEAGRGLELIDGLLGLYGGDFGTTADRCGPGKSVHVTVRFPQEQAAVSP